ncbi:Zinc finger BED domain containing protein 5 [Dissostichus eleginoides]|uniref:Zinc finger BED domain containing protein 5 n=1 Tax=Dissostichus eleginoides TaxID=100907 RepID=A0AAD9F862_DISEL|nr:Zinc finger BED domain containing protein 5 [Dissostichus eleginoides]
MCPTSGPSCGTAEVIYQKMDEALQKNAIPWRNCNMAASTSMGAPVTSSTTLPKAGLGFLEVCGFDPEDLTVDVGYWFKGSTNRKGYMTEFCELHGSEYLEILMHVSIRWLSLERCLTRILQQYEPLASYFKSSNEKQPRFRRLLEAFSNPMTEVCLLFYQATLPVLSTFNLLLQREKSSIFLLHDEIRSFIRKLLSKFLKPAALQHRELHQTNCQGCLCRQVMREKLVIGFTTRATLNRLLDAGDITPQQVQRFQQAAVAFLSVECGVEDALYFVDRFPELLPYNGPDERDKLSEEFLDYQSMDIAMPEDPATFDIESFWGNMASMKNKVTGMSRFGRLSRIAKLVLRCFDQSFEAMPVTA